MNISASAIFYRNKLSIKASMQLQLGNVNSGVYRDVFAIPNYNAAGIVYAPVVFTGGITGNLRITESGVVGIRPYANITNSNWANVCFDIPTL